MTARASTYPDGFGFGLKCPKDRCLNDETVCQAVVGMLAQASITAEFDTMPFRDCWPELREDNFGMYMRGWSPGTFDREHPTRFLVSTPNSEKKPGRWNFGGHSNARIDERLPMIQSEIDVTNRQAMQDEVSALFQDEHARTTTCAQPFAWGAQSSLELTQRPDNSFILCWVRVN